MSAPIIIHGNAFVSHWYVKPERRDDFIKLFNALWQGAEEQMGVLTNFVFYGWGRDPNEFVAIESWKSEEIVSEVRKSDGFKTTLLQLYDCCSKPMLMDAYSPWEGSRELFSLFPAGPSTVHPRTETMGAIWA